LATWSFVLIFAILEIIVFTWMWHYNDKIFQNQLFFRHSLTERYQVKKNYENKIKKTPSITKDMYNLY